ncbi:hypothetical protein L7F22_011748 [Adiantum nelumboides]|nr:hypothetical protein [Adiantum nelumboides]
MALSVTYSLLSPSRLFSKSQYKGFLAYPTNCLAGTARNADLASISKWKIRNKRQKKASVIVAVVNFPKDYADVLEQTSHGRGSRRRLLRCDLHRHVIGDVDVLKKLQSKDMLDITKFKANNITKAEDPEVEEGDHDPLQCTSTFPTYKVHKKEYVLLNDIQNLFDLRKDYALAILAEWTSNDKGFIDYSPCLLAILKIEAENFFDNSSARKHARHCSKI